MRRPLSNVALGLLIVAGFIFAETAPKLDFDKVDPRKMLTDPYSYWSQPYNFYYFHHMDKVPKQRLDWVRKPGQAFRLLETTAPFSLTYTVNDKTYSLDDYLLQGDVLGLLVMKDNQIVYEKYLHDAMPEDRFLSMSISKSVVSVLIGVALEEGKLHSVDDPVTQYLPYLKDSAYKDATLKNLLQMASGIEFNEDYLDPKADIHRVIFDLIRGGEPFKETAVALKQERKPGTAFHYQSINTQMLGLILEKVTGTPLNKYAEEKLWKKIGAESDAFFYESKNQPEICAFGCFNATLRDYARFGLMAMNYGKLGDTRVVNDAWMRESTTAPAFNPGYGYQWWLTANSPDHVFRAIGIYGQTIYINPAKHVVIAQFRALPKPSGALHGIPPSPFEAIVGKLAP
ncbi:MAG TPA: serine hydrolase [Bryobacteraceae bacterium]|jgi:CubicO group peptidase (beta-lactamase class C family)|nr:serine hydrolase [Bryobacteraceae bacterium]